MSAGIKYIPADKSFYTDFQYKVELRPKFKGMGTIGGKRGCTIDVSNPSKARTQLTLFNAQMDKVLTNAEHRQAICEYVDNLQSVTYKSRIGGENNLFYFRDAAHVMAVLDQYGADIISVTGPINDKHAAVIDKCTTIMRDTLYFNKYRVYVEMSPDFVIAGGEDAERLADFISDLPRESYRMMNYKAAIRKWAQGISNRAQWYRVRSQPKKIGLHLCDVEDYVYLKLLIGEYIISSREVILFADVSSD